MRVVIVGAGEVGSDIAASFADEHRVSVVDNDPTKADELTYSLDVLSVEGDGTSHEVLEEAGIGEADMLIASTDDDETNLVTCATAETIKDVFTIARVRDVSYFETWKRSQSAFDVDFMVSANMLTASNIVDIVGLPAAINVDPFAEGLVQMAEFEVPERCSIVNQTVAEADTLDALTFAALIRDGEVTIPSGETGIEAGDELIVIGRPDSIQEFAGVVTPPETSPEAESVVVIGGSDIGYYTARLLEEGGYEPRLIEQDDDRARQLAEELTGTVVMNHDGTDLDFLVSEHVDEADTVVAALDSDEKNLMISLLAKRIGARRAVSVVENGTYADHFEKLGVDATVNPRKATAEEIIRFTQGSQIKSQLENLSLVENRQSEVLEIEVDTDSVLADRPIRKTVSELPSDVVIGAITRRSEFIVPRGDTVIEPGDHVVLFVATDALADVTAAV